jgi:hypothetical protein
MHRSLSPVVVATAVVATTASADTLNFENVPSTRINQTVGETPSNEKYVDHGDFDNDGDLDVVIGNAQSDFGQRRNKLYRNDGGVFQEVSGAPIISGFSATDVSRTAFLRDFDNDGWLDIYVINDSNAGFGAGTDKIYMNEHPGGTFSHFNDESATRLVFASMSGCSSVGCTGAACTGVSFDIDGDSYNDVYCGNYPNSSQDRMYFNQGAGNPGVMTYMGTSYVPVDGDYTVDVDATDMNGDGKTDLLIANDFDLGKIYYNDNNGAGSGLGDFNYSGSVQTLAVASSGENAMAGGDFDGDGDNDIYWGNRSSSTGDRILRNDGNDGSNKAILTLIDILPPSVTGVHSRKITVADLNNDKRVDLFVGKDITTNSRPTVLRNTSVGGGMSFVDWSPGVVFETGQVHRGWDGAIFDSNGDGDLDILLGGWTNDHLFEQVPPVMWDEDDLGPGAVIPSVFNRDANAVTGSVGEGTSDEYVIDNLSGNGFVSVVLNGADDYLLEVLDGGVVASSDRGGLGVEEALQHNDATLPATLMIRVTGNACASPWNLAGDCGVSTEDLLDLLSNWGSPYSTADLLDLLSSWGPSDYTLEVLAREG